MNLAWTVDDLSRLSQSGRTLLVELVIIKEMLEDWTTDLVAKNVARRLTQLHLSLITFIKGIFYMVDKQLGLYRHRSNHIFVIMISTEYRSRKPYALPVQCFSYKGITVSKMRCVLNKVVAAMTERKMNVNST